MFAQAGIAATISNFHGLFLTVLILLMGTGVLLRWRMRWQLLLDLSALGALATYCLLTGRWDVFGFPRWLALAAAFGVAHAGNLLAERRRAELSRHVERLREIQAHLRREIVQREAAIDRLAQAQEKERTGAAAVRKLFDASLDVALVFGRDDGVVVDLNAEFLRTGYTREKVLGRRAARLPIWTDLDDLREFNRRLDADGVVRSMEVAFRAPDGATRTHLVSAFPIDFGGVARVVASARNVEELRHAERRLQAGDERFRRVFDASLDAISIRRYPEGTYIDVNRAFEASGYARDRVLGKTPAEIGRWSDSQARRLADELKRRGHVRNFEVDIRAGDGRTVPSLVSSALVKIGAERCIVSITRDVSEIKEARRKLELGEAALRSILSASPDLIVVNRLADGAAIDLNAELASAGAPWQLVRGNPDDIAVWKDPQARKTFIDTLIRAGSVRNFEADFRLPDGETAAGLISASIAQINGEPCAISFVRDIRELKQAERDLVTARETALAASRSKSEFLSIMSHEIRTPMNVVLGMTDMLWESPLNAEQRRYLEIMRSNGAALLDLINDILDLARVESGRLSLERTEFDLEDLLSAVVQMTAVRAHEKRLELVVRVAPETPTRLVGDPLRLRQIMLNLLGNAIKFTARGEIELTVEAAADSSAGENGGGADRRDVMLSFSVRDTGIGIPADRIGSLFTRFTQADSSTARKYGGSGLGLTIVQRLVELYGGKVTLESVEHRGSRFAFTARLGVSDAGAPPRPAPLELAGTRVLVADDTPANRTVAREILAPLGAEIVEADDGEQALGELRRAAAAGTPYRVALLDSRMPRMDGLEAASRAVKDPRFTTAIVMMLTADELSLSLARMRQAGLSGYLAKPIRRANVVEAIGAALSQEFVAPRLITLDINLNRAPAPAPARAEEASARGARGAKVLLADDSADNCLLVRAYLKKTGYELDAVGNGRAALERFKTGSYDLVLMDIQMPVMDGYAATRAIREWEREQSRAPVPIIALSASAQTDAVRKAIEAGCDSHVAKPVSKSTLLEALRRVPAEWAAPHPVVTVNAELSDLVPAFLAGKREEISAALAALSKGDCGPAEEAGHRLKGEGASYGFPALSTMGEHLESAGKSSDLARARRYAQELAGYLDRVEVVYQNAS